MKFYIETFGCQMNQYDSEIVAGLLESRGGMHVYDSTQADLYLVNSCSVREHAEDRLFKRLQELSAWKRSLPGRRIGLLGCTAQRMGKKILERVSHLDLVAGTEAYGHLPVLVEKAFSAEVAVDTGLAEWENSRLSVRSFSLSAFVAVSRGCDNNCTYCIVPFVRGPERSRPAHTVLTEIRALVTLGVKETVLLGQNVNSYRDQGFNDQGGGRSMEPPRTPHGFGFVELLREVDEIPGIARIGFLTSHPKDLSVDILWAMAQSRHVTHHLHLPLQSGSDKILEGMNRQYTLSFYTERVLKAREIMPNLRLTTDLITGFPGETEQDFQATLRAVEDLRFDEAFTFYYSERQETPAASLPDPIALPIRKERLSRLIAQTSRIASDQASRQVGRETEVFVEGPSRKDPRKWKGRSRENREVVFHRNGHRPGDLVRMTIQGRSGRVLLGI